MSVVGVNSDDDADDDDNDTIYHFFRCRRSAKRFVGYQLKRDVTHNNIISASCFFCGEVYGNHIEEVCRNEDETTRFCVTTFLAELKAFSQSRGW